MILSVHWRGAVGAHAWMTCVPVAVSTPDLDLMLAPGERVQFPGGRARIIVDVPGFTGIDYDADLPVDGRFRLVLDCSALTRRDGADVQLRPTRVAVQPSAWAPGLGTEPALSSEILFAGDSQGITLSCSSGARLPIRLEVVTPTNPRRKFAVPMVSPRGDARLVWRARPNGGFRPRIEPVDPTGLLLMEYLIAGRNTAAATAARAVQAFRGADQCLDWTAPSYTQLLIGYSYAAGRDVMRLRAWCRRTSAADQFGPDGRVLAAAAAYWSGARKQARDLLAAGEGAPSLVYGGELALVLTALLDVDRVRQDESRSGTRSEDNAGMDGPGDALARVHGSLLHLLGRVDVGAATVSTPGGRATTLDLTYADTFRRWRQQVRFALSKWRYDLVFRSTPTQMHHLVRQGRAAMADQESSSTQADPARRTKRYTEGATLTGVGLGVAATAVAAWLAFSVLLLTVAGTSTDVTWTRMAWVFGSIQAVAFSAAGALFGTSVQASRVAQSEAQSKAATQKAEQHAEDASKGRAIGAMLQAEALMDGSSETGTSGLIPMAPTHGGDDAELETRRRHALLSRALFGDLVGGNSQEGVSSSTAG